MDWMLLPLKRYADFAGRSRRKEYWMFVLGYTIVGAVLVGLLGAVGGFSSSGAKSPGVIVVGLLFAVFALALLVPSIAVQIRRFHDQDRSGWWWLIAFVPYLGGLILLVFMCIEGTKGPNRFGEDPKASTTPYP